ncbi:hypothetical protein D3C87_1139410 [compost metagenome]
MDTLHKISINGVKGSAQRLMSLDQAPQPLLNLTGAGLTVHTEQQWNVIGRPDMLVLIDSVQSLLYGSNRIINLLRRPAYRLISRIC